MPWVVGMAAWRDDLTAEGLVECWVQKLVAKSAVRLVDWMVEQTVGTMVKTLVAE